MRFSVRDLLWATLVVALCVGWWLDHCALAVRRAEDERFFRLETSRGFVRSP
jgi:hypothetical protein